MRGLRLHYRIVVPFVMVALAGTAAAALLALTVTSDALQARLQSQLLSAAGVVSQSDLALSPAILRNLQEVLGAHIVTFDEQGQILASTVPHDRPEIVAAARAAVATDVARTAEIPAVLRLDCGAPCLVATRRVTGRPGTTVALVAETAELAQATRTVARGLILASVMSLVVMGLVSQAVVRRVTRPLDALVRFVRELSPNDRGKRSPVGANEIGVLAQSFNDMLERVERAQDAAVRSEKLALAGLIAARVAHDIRNPMSSIKMQTQLVHARLHDRDDQAALRDVLHDIDQVESVISDLLELARPGELRREPTDLNAVVDDALSHLAAQFAHRKVVVDRRLDPALPLVSLDQARLKRAILNLLVNASEAMTTGGTLVISTRAASDGVAAQICDDGVGIDPATLAHAFDPFVSTKRDGVGLGLVNAKAVVDGHGGRITLEPRLPRGTCATVWLPVASQSPVR